MRKTRKNTRKRTASRKNANKTFIAKKLLKPNVIQSVLGILFVILGLIFLYAVPTIPRNETVSREPITAGKDFVKNKKESQVTRIIIPQENIDVEVKPAKIIGGYWETSEKTASHGEGTANPGEKGNVVIFAHAREGLFYNLRDVKMGDFIYVFTKNRWYRYKVNEIKSVLPNQVETIAPTNNEVLTLFTCSGFFDEKRLIIKALPVKQ